MNGSDHRADNLLLRIFSYTPRVGRLPLEDFCTEALAWCLRKSSKFQSGFLKSLNLEVGDQQNVGIATQNQYEFEAVEGDNSGDGCDAGRFDMLVTIGDELYAVVETKVGAGFGPNQLTRYRQQVKRQQEAFGFKKGLLITLTDSSEKPEASDVHQSWASVQRLLENLAEGEGVKEYATNVCVQFAEFLKEKGLGPMNVPKIAAAPVNEWVEGLRFRQRLENVLKNVTNESELLHIFGRKRIAFEETPDGKVWVGIYGMEQHFWIGFGFRKQGNGIETFMLVQKAVEGDRRRQFQKLKPEFADGKTWLNVERVLDAEFDGDGEKIREWLLRSAKSLVEIR